MPPYLADVIATLNTFLRPSMSSNRTCTCPHPHSDLHSDSTHTLQTPSYIPEERELANVKSQMSKLVL